MRVCTAIVRYHAHSHPPTAHGHSTAPRLAASDRLHADATAAIPPGQRAHDQGRPRRRGQKPALGILVRLAPVCGAHIRLHEMIIGTRIFQTCAVPSGARAKGRRGLSPDTPTIFNRPPMVIRRQPQSRPHRIGLTLTPTRCFLAFSSHTPKVRRCDAVEKLPLAPCVRLPPVRCAQSPSHVRVITPWV